MEDNVIVLDRFRIALLLFLIASGLIIPLACSSESAEKDQAKTASAGTSSSNAQYANMLRELISIQERVGTME